MKRTSYNIELLKQIWENLSPNQRIECLRQADRGDCAAPFGLDADVWKAVTHYMNYVDLAKVAHIEGGECEAIRLTISGKAILLQLESNTKVAMTAPTQEPQPSPSVNEWWGAAANWINYKNKEQ